MEKNRYTGLVLDSSFLLQEIEGVNLFLSVVAGHWFDCLGFNPFQSSEYNYKKKKWNYYLIGQFGHEKNHIHNNSDVRIIKDLGVLKSIESKNRWGTAKKWLKENCNIENVKIKLLYNTVFENRHFYFNGDNLILKRLIELPYDFDFAVKIFYFKKTAASLCDHWQFHQSF